MLCYIHLESTLRLLLVNCFVLCIIIILYEFVKFSYCRFFDCVYCEIEIIDFYGLPWKIIYWIFFSENGSLSTKKCHKIIFLIGQLFIIFYLWPRQKLVSKFYTKATSLRRSNNFVAVLSRSVIGRGTLWTSHVMYLVLFCKADIGTCAR